MRELNLTIIPSRAAATVNSVAINAENLFAISGQFVGTGSAAGTLKLQASNDAPVINGQGGAPTNWADIPSATVTIAGAGVYLLPKTDICYQWVRFAYTNTGTGTMAAIAKAQGA